MNPLDIDFSLLEANTSRVAAFHIGHTLSPASSNFTSAKILDTSSSRSDTVRIGYLLIETDTLSLKRGRLYALCSADGFLAVTIYLITIYRIFNSILTVILSLVHENI